MKTIAMLSQKGGAGKTTVALHLAVLAHQRGLRVALVDLDPQASALEWWHSREGDEPTTVAVKPDELGAALKAAEGDGFDLIVLDTAPHAEAAIAAAARACDFAVVPCRPGILDLRAVGKTADILKAIKRPFAVVLNSCPPSRGFGEPSIVVEARDALRLQEIPAMKTTLTQRAAFGHSLIDGRAVTEFAPDSPAAREIAALLNEIEGMV